MGEAMKSAEEMLADLHRESLREWTIRFHRERGLPVPDDKELEELIKLSEQDINSAHQ